MGFAIAGSGMIAGVHATALKEIPGVRVVGVWSLPAEDCQRFAAQHQIRGFAS
jgi:predicted dehydrogenase